MKAVWLFFLVIVGHYVQAQEPAVQWATQDTFFESLVDKPLADFQGRTVDGKIFSSRQLKNKIVIINFWFEQCPPCIAEMPELNKLVEKYGKSQVRFIGITHDLPEKAKRFQNSIPYHYLVVSLSKQEIAKLNINHGFPSNVLVGKNGKIRFAMANFSLTDEEFQSKSQILESKLNDEIKKSLND